MEFRRPDVDQFLSELTASQFAEWEAMYALEPWGERREDLRTAKIVQAICNFAAGRTKDTPFVKAEEVFDTLAADPSEVQTPEEMRAAMGVRGKRKRNERSERR